MADAPQMGSAPVPDKGVPDNLSHQVRSAVIWRSGAQLIAQAISWGATLMVIRILTPSDFGLFAMTAVVLAFMNFLNGYQFASALVQAESLSEQRIRQTFGIMLLLNAGLAALQLGLAPLIADYYGQPIVAQMLRWQALIYLATPFMAIPEVLLARALDFRRTAIVNLSAALVGAAVSLGCALAGAGVWTLVAAPVALFWTRAIGLNIAAPSLRLPSFDLRGSSAMLSFGISLLIAQGLWVVQSQADVFIAGRTLDPHALGLYAESVFLTSIFASKFVPPLNEVAFPAYARLQRNPAKLAAAFAKAMRLILALACPLYLGLAVAAEPAILLIFGPKWTAMVPLVRLIALAMPMMTLHILFAPAVNATGHPGRSARAAAAGAVIMPLAFLAGVQFGAHGLAAAWIAAYPPLIAYTYLQARPVLGISLGQLARAAAPGLSAALGMAALVWSLDRLLPPLMPLPHLAALVAAGVTSYAVLLKLFHPALLGEVAGLLPRFGRRRAVQTARI